MVVAPAKLRKPLANIPLVLFPAADPNLLAPQPDAATVFAHVA
jgi:hypothetical protein